MADKDPLADAIAKFAKSAPDAIKKGGKSVKDATNLHSALKKKDKSFQSALKKFIASLATDKKKVSGDAKAKKEIEVLEKLAAGDLKKRMTLGKVKVTKTG